jgi:hypothetical protein
MPAATEVRPNPVPMSRTPDSRGQSGLDRLAVFVLAVVVVLLVVPAALGLAGIDVRGGGPAGPGADPSLVVLGVAGTVGENHTVGVVRVVVTNAGGGRIDPATLDATWVGNGTYRLVASGGDADGTYTVGPVGADRADAVLDEHGDRAVLTFDLGTDDLSGAAEFAGRLEPGETATVTLVAPGGATARADVAVPVSAPAGGTVAL